MPTVVFVVATTLEGTRAALNAGVPLARGSRARLVVLVNDLLHVMPPASTVVIGGTTGALLPSREERLTRRLASVGYNALFTAAVRPG